MKRTLICNATLVLMDAQRRVLTGHTLIIGGDKIEAIVPANKVRKQPGDTVIDLTDRFILPGLVNSHVHTVQHLARGLSDDVDILTWLHKRIWPYESALKPEESYLATMLCGIEQIQNGVTSMADAGIHHAAPTVRAIEELGLRATLCYSIMDEGEGLPKAWRLTPADAIQKQEAAYREFNGAANGRVEWWLGLRTLMNLSDTLVMKTIALGEKLDTWIHMHVAEGPAETAIISKSRGTSTVRHLSKLGILGPKFLAVHCVSVDDDEIDLFAKNGVKVSHNPAAALRVMGFAPIVEMTERGVTVSIATDGAPSNCRNSLIDEMYLAALLQKGRKVDARIMPATQVLQMVTRDAARCLGWETKVGSLEVGKAADLCVVNPKTANMYPLHDPISNLVFSMKTRNIESTMCDGKWLMWNHKILVCDVEEILTKAQRAAAAIRTRARIKLPQRFLWQTACKAGSFCLLAGGLFPNVGFA